MSIKLLILDDEREILNSLKRLLKMDRRFHLYTTTSPEKALDLLKKENIQVVISDIVMPEMNGIEFLERAKAVNGLVQVVMMTAYSSVERVLACLEKGAADYLMKPFSNEELKEVLDGIVARLQRWRRLVIMARAVSDGKEVPQGKGDRGPGTVDDSLDERIEELKREASNSEELAASLMEWIEQEQSQVVKERLAMALSSALASSMTPELLERMLISRDAFLRNFIIGAARDMGWEVMESLVHLFSSPDKDVRKLVLDIAAEVRHDGGMEIFMKALDDEDPNIRATAIEFLGIARHEPAVSRLEEMLLQEQEPMLKATLLEALTNIGHSPRSMEIIGYLRKEDDPILLHSLLKYIGVFGSKDDFHWLVDGLDSGKLLFTREAMDALYHLLRRHSGLDLSDKIVGWLTEEAKNATNALSAYQALMTLHEAVPESAMNLARELATAPESPSRDAAIQILAELGDGDDRALLEGLLEKAQEQGDDGLIAIINEALERCAI